MLQGARRRDGMIYDVAIIGAGPAGLMAAKTAAELGLKTILAFEWSSEKKLQKSIDQSFAPCKLLHVH